MPSRPRIAVIGSGPAAAGVLHALSDVSQSTDVTIFDVKGPEAEVDSKPPPPPASDPAEISHFYDSIYRELKSSGRLEIPPSKNQFGQRPDRCEVGGKPRFARGANWSGLSRYWGGTMLPLTKKEFEDWPIAPEELTPHYQAIANIVGVSGRRDALSDYYGVEFANRPPLKMLSVIQSLDTAIHGGAAQGNYQFLSGVNRIALETRPEMANACVYCGECMSGCFRNAVYSTKDCVARWIALYGARFVQGKVLKLDPARRSLSVRTENAVQTFSDFDRIYLAAGCVGSTEILMRSFEISEGPVMLDNAVMTFPILYFGGDLAPEDRDSYFAITQLLLIGRSRDATLHDTQIQIYPNMDYLWRMMMPEALWPLCESVVRWSRGRVIWARLYLPAGNSYHYGARLSNSSLTFEELKKPVLSEAQSVISSLRSLLHKRSFWIPPWPPSFVATSEHLAASFPFGGKRIAMDSAGEIAPGVYLCDATAFPSSPMTSPTFTIMANSHRIGRRSLQ